MHLIGGRQVWKILKCMDVTPRLSKLPSLKMVIYLHIHMYMYINRVIREEVYISKVNNTQNDVNREVAENFVATTKMGDRWRFKI